MLCLEWLTHKRVLSTAELDALKTSEYIGGLSDFTGEIGRLAVMAASSRDIATVEEIHQIDVVLSLMLTKINVGNRYGKKLDALNTNLKKVEQLLFEMKMSQRNGRKSLGVAAEALNFDAANNTATSAEKEN